MALQWLDIQIQSAFEDPLPGGSTIVSLPPPSPAESANWQSRRVF
jgi:hypothetical protein